MRIVIQASEKFERIWRHPRLRRVLGKAVAQQGYIHVDSQISA